MAESSSNLLNSKLKIMMLNSFTLCFIMVAVCFISEGKAGTLQDSCVNENSFICFQSRLAQCINRKWVLSDCPSGTHCDEAIPSQAICKINYQSTTSSSTKMITTTTSTTKSTNTTSAAKTTTSSQTPIPSPSQSTSKSITTSSSSPTQSSSSCVSGNYQCNGSGYQQCSNGQWFNFACGTGTQCVQISSLQVLCEVPSQSTSSSQGSSDQSSSSSNSNSGNVAGSSCSSFGSYLCSNGQQYVCNYNTPGSIALTWGTAGRSC